MFKSGKTFRLILSISIIIGLTTPGQSAPTDSKSVAQAAGAFALAGLCVTGLYYAYHGLIQYFRETDEHFFERLQKEFHEAKQNNKGLVAIFELPTTLETFTIVVNKLNALDTITLSYINKIADLQSLAEERIAQKEKAYAPLKILHTEIHAYLALPAILSAQNFLRSHDSYIALQRYHQNLLATFSNLINSFLQGDRVPLENSVRINCPRSTYPHIDYVYYLEGKMSALKQYVNALSIPHNEFQATYVALFSESQYLYGNINKLREAVLSNPKYESELRQQKQDRLEEERIAVQQQAIQAQAAMAAAMQQQALATHEQAIAAQHQAEATYAQAHAAMNPPLHHNGINQTNQTQEQSWKPTCCKCNTRKDNKDQLVCLAQCKHKICHGCARKHFDEQQYVTCPTCHAAVDLKDLQDSKVIAHRYASDECCVCLEDMTSSTRVFLWPCGHDMCRSCAKETHIARGIENCSKCRSAVDKRMLQYALNTR